VVSVLGVEVATALSGLGALLDSGESQLLLRRVVNGNDSFF